MSITKYRKTYSNRALRQFKRSEKCAISNVYREFIFNIITSNKKRNIIISDSGLSINQLNHILYLCKPALDYFEGNAKWVRSNTEERKKNKIIDNIKS